MEREREVFDINKFTISGNEETVITARISIATGATVLPLTLDSLLSLAFVYVYTRATPCIGIT